VLEKLAETTLAKEHPLHPNFDTLYNFSADLAATMQRRLLQAIWKGRAVEDDGPAKRDLEKHLAPLGLLDTSRPGEVVLTIGSTSNECFRKLRERVRDRIRKSTSEPPETSVPDLRADLKAKDTGLTDDWIDVVLTVLLTLGDVRGVTTDGHEVSLNNKLGEPRDWLPKLIKLRPGGKPDDALWKDVVRSLQALGHWTQSTAYTAFTSDMIHEVILRLALVSETELAKAREILSFWPGAPVPVAFTEHVDLFNVAPEDRSNRTACMTSTRSALRDVLGLPADDGVDQLNRYKVVEEWAARLQEARDFLTRAEEMRSIASRTAQLTQASLPRLRASSETSKATIGVNTKVNTPASTARCPR
jgi:hypothetical protein